MAKKDPPEIIDLTESPPREVIVLDSDSDDTPNNTGRENGARRVWRKKKKTKTTPPDDGGVNESSVSAFRDRSRERDRDRKDPPLRRRRSRSPQPQHKSPSPQPRDNLGDLFFVDIEPAPVPDSVKLTGLPETSPQSTKLLLPDHVSILELGEGANGTGPIEIIRASTPNPSEDDDFIEYADYDEQNKVRYYGSSGTVSALNELLKGVIRYFDALDESSKPTKFVCKNCGVEGEHRTFECPVQIVRTSLVHIFYVLPLDQNIIEVFDMRCTKRALNPRLSD